MTYIPLHHKYRPQTFSQLVGQEAIATTLSNALLQNRIAPAYLFTGARGTGKTSSARIFAKSLNCIATNAPTDKPCGVCQTCQEITKGNALDVIEIDAASNTGVDNIRELIERAQFAPVQCRYKVYVIDECLTGDTFIQTEQGFSRIDDPTLMGKQVLSYNDETGTWEYKKVLNWFNQGIRQVFLIKTGNRTIRCTGNHLIRTKDGWIAASNLKAKMQILSPQIQQDNLEPLLARVVNDLSTCIQERPRKQWHTNLEKIESIELGELEAVYDIEVEDNHNFVANGLLVHNCHMLTSASFNALLKTLEEPPEQVVFVLATTDPQRVLPTIISRCQRFDFRRIPIDSMVSHLKAIAQKEQIAIADDAIYLISQISQGGLRDAQSLLDQLSLLSGDITVERVWDLVGAVPEQDLMALIAAIAQNQPEAVLDTTRRLMDRGREPLIVLQNLASFYRDLLIAKTAPTRGDLVAITAPTWAQLCEFAKAISIESILSGQQRLKESEVQLRNSTQPRLWLEVTLMGLLPSAIASAPATLPVQATIPKPITKSIEPLPQPVEAPKPVEEAAPKVEVSEPQKDSTDLDRLWQTIISKVQPFGTQALFKQHGTLLSFDGNTAQVGIPEKLLPMAQSRSKSMVTALAKTFEKEIKLSLVVAPTSDTPPSTEAKAEEPSKPVLSEPTIEPAVEELPEIVPPRADWDEDEVTRAARILAEAFNGEVINAEDSAIEPLETSDQPLSADAATLEEVEEEEEDDDDTPF